MKNIAIVPARSGSKGVPGKNLKVLGGKTLTHRALSAALSSDIFDDIILTTDIPVFLEEIPKGWTLHPRVESLALDDTPMADVVMDVIQSKGIPEDALIWLLQPTSPFREPQHFHRILDIFRRDDAKSVMSVSSVGDSHPSRHYKLTEDGDLAPLFLKLASFDNRQNLKPVFERNGMYYVTSCRDFKAKRSFYVHKCKSFLMDKLQSFNINDELDFKLAQAVSSWI